MLLENCLSWFSLEEKKSNTAHLSKTANSKLAVDHKFLFELISSDSCISVPNGILKTASVFNPRRTMNASFIININILWDVWCFNISLMESLHSKSGAQFEMRRRKRTGVRIHLSLSDKSNNCSFTSVHLNYTFLLVKFLRQEKNDSNSRQMVLNWGGGEVCWGKLPHPQLFFPLLFLKIREKIIIRVSHYLQLYPQSSAQRLFLQFHISWKYVMDSTLDGSFSSSLRI